MNLLSPDFRTAMGAALLDLPMQIPAGIFAHLNITTTSGDDFDVIGIVERQPEFTLVRARHNDESDGEIALWALFGPDASEGRFTIFPGDPRTVPVPVLDSAIDRFGFVRAVNYVRRLPYRLAIASTWTLPTRAEVLS
ncbi:MAG: hypothetical protein H5U40_05350 [Polyangiaceae bacterium]|nr:hypothetical protein [Polyangiaceae bacterium]